MSIKIKFTLFLDEEKTVKCFEAIVAEEKKYDILYDPNSLYEDMLEEIVNGLYKTEYLQYESDGSGNIVPKLDTNGFPDYQSFEIIGTNSIENIKKFIEFQKIAHEYISDINEEPEFYPIFGIHLDGHEFGYGENMMSPEIVSKTIASVNKISNAAISNNTKYIREKAASYEVHIDSVNRDLNVISFFTNLYTEIENECLDNQRYIENASTNKYRTVIKELGNLASFKKLTSFNIFIDGEEKSITKINYLLDFVSDPYDDEQKEYIGTLKSPDYINKTFEMKSENIVWHCHLEDGLEDLFEKVVNSENRGKELKVTARQKSPATIIATNITIH
jgi:hypothetical protein